MAGTSGTGAAEPGMAEWLQAAWGWLRVQGYRAHVLARRSLARHFRKRRHARTRRLVLSASVITLAAILLARPGAGMMATAAAGLAGIISARLAPGKVFVKEARRRGSTEDPAAPGGAQTGFCLAARDAAVPGAPGYPLVVLSCRRQGCGWGLAAAELELRELAACARRHWEGAHAGKGRVP